MQQSPSDRVEVGQCGGNLQSMQVLGESSVTDLLEAEHTLDDSDGVFNLGAHLRFRLVLRLLQLVEPTPAAVPAVREVFGPRGAFPDDLRLPLVALTACSTSSSVRK